MSPAPVHKPKRSWIQRILGQSRKEDARFALELTGEGAEFVAPHANASSDLLSYQRALLEQMEEEGLAEAIPAGYFVAAPELSRLGDDEARLLALPVPLEGKLELSVTGRTTQHAFQVKGQLCLPDGDRLPLPPPYGVVIHIPGLGDRLLRGPWYDAARALDDHARLESAQRTEPRNLALVASLQSAERDGLPIDLRHFRDLEVVVPDKPSVAVTKMRDGSLRVSPNFGEGIAVDDVDLRLGQLEGEDGNSLRVRDKIVLLDGERRAAVKEVMQRHHIPAAEAKQFLETPSAFLDPGLIDLETGFAVRVEGVTVFQHIPSAEFGGSGTDWFEAAANACSPEVIVNLISSFEELSEFECNLEEARQSGAAYARCREQSIDISEPEAVDQALDKVRDRLVSEPSGAGGDKPKKERATFELKEALEGVDGKPADTAGPIDIDYSAYKRTPFTHQREGIEWMLRLSAASLRPETREQGPQGGLLADDMGLGKTYMAIVAVDQYLQRMREVGETEKPVLVVAPLSLLQNWADEVEKTAAQSPFDDVVILQADRDLNRFRLEGQARETHQDLEDGQLLDESSVRYALRVGTTYPDSVRLDRPRRLVLTSYDTLRNYQFSLGRIDWSWVIFDEAQNVKNPNTLQTRAAAALRAQFKLLATGTPVENRLSEFWCIMDIAQPGLLGTWSEFKDSYVSPAESDPVGVGRQLHSDVGRFMLRRVKEDVLDGLPPKTILRGARMPTDDEDASFRQFLRAPMTDVQIRHYDQALSDLHALKEANQGNTGALKALHRLRQVSLHPALLDKAADTQSPQQWAAESGKVMAIRPILEQIRAANEKVLIFAIYKTLQRHLKVWLEAEFGVPVSIVNGETKTRASGHSPSRLQIIDRFQQTPGFAILIMSPVAAGVGLTVTEANHVIHLERHWNPAKEAQATDRVYRIGQQRPVQVYLPASAHPQFTSFDDKLDQLLKSKESIKDAVISPALDESAVLSTL